MEDTQDIDLTVKELKKARDGNGPQLWDDKAQNGNLKHIKFAGDDYQEMNTKDTLKLMEIHTQSRS